MSTSADKETNSALWSTFRCTYLVALKIIKLVLSSLGNYIVLAATGVTSSANERAVFMKQALANIPNPNTDCVVREVAAKVAVALHETGTRQQTTDRFLSALPDKNTLKAVMLISWACATGKEEALHESVEIIGQMIATPANGQAEILATCKEALEVMTVMFMLSPHVLEAMVEDPHFRKFLVDLVLISPER